jgi:hypothetical protein
MRSGLILVLLALVACTSKDDYPIGPGGGGGGGGGGNGGADAPTGDGTSGVLERVCLIGVDLRTPTTLGLCDASHASGFTVALGNETATTAADGTFVLTPDQESAPIWRVSDTAQTLRPSLIPFVPGEYILPTISTTNYQSLSLTDNQTAVVPGAGSIFVQIYSKTNTRPSGITVATNPPATAVLYDGANAMTWSTTGPTSTNAAAWLPNLPPGSYDITLHPATTGVNGTVSAVRVEADSNTYVIARMPQ